MSRAAQAFLSTENLRHNVGVLKAQAPQAKFIAMIKANAYGHGLRSVALRLEGHVDILGVASIDEARALRKTGIQTPILLMEGVFEPEELTLAAAENFHLVFHHVSQLEWLENFPLSQPICAWIKVNTGMGRLGILTSKFPAYYRRLKALSYVNPCVGIMSHLACAEDLHHPMNLHQVHTFQTLIQDISSEDSAEFSLCNSAGIFHFPQAHYDYIRIGLALYGVSPIPGKSAKALGLKPVMTVRTRLISVSVLPAGACVGYGCHFQCSEDMPVGIIAFGYGDGYPISAPEGTPVLVNGQECPLVGRISMDMMAVDLRPCYPHVSVGDWVTLWGEGLPLEKVAQHIPHAISWSLLTGIQNRVKFHWTPL